MTIVDTQSINNNQQNVPVGAGSSRPLESVIPTAVEGSKSSSHLLPIILSSLITIIVLVGAYLLFLNKTPQTIIANPSPASSDIISPSTDPTANWKIYIDPTYNYSFKYPNLWADQTGSQDKLQGSFIIEAENKERIHGVIFSGVPDLENDKKNNGSSQSFALNSQKYLFVTYVECDGPGCSLGTKQMNIFNQILSTFKFMDINVVDQCTTDAQCGVNICDCRADLIDNITNSQKACTRVCNGQPRCINNQCILK